jgi:hypothetical protein
MITQQEVIAAQEKWAEGIVEIGSYKDNWEKCKAAAEAMIRELYAYDVANVLFKPTKAAEIQFRITMEGARSYFIAGDDFFPEDNGFALQPWKQVRFVNAGIILEETRAIAMGNYFFKDLEDKEIKVEYTFGYIRTKAGKVKIDLHHSSLPFSG